MSKTKQMVINAMLAAMCAVLGYVALDMTTIKVTFESLPVFLGALLFGPVAGMLIGGVGTFIYQLLRYGVSATTLLWILPYVVAGGVCGLAAKKNSFSLDRKKVILLTVACELIITVMNTGVMYVDSKMYGYYFPGYITGSLLIRLVICVVKAVAFGAVLPTLVNSVKKYLA